VLSQVLNHTDGGPSATAIYDQTTTTARSGRRWRRGADISTPSSRATRHGWCASLGNGPGANSVKPHRVSRSVRRHQPPQFLEPVHLFVELPTAHSCTGRFQSTGASGHTNPAWLVHLDPIPTGSEMQEHLAPKVARRTFGSTANHIFTHEASLTPNAKGS
jgi:hypothetical protein